jgi:hypothetical protein
MTSLPRGAADHAGTVVAPIRNRKKENQDRRPARIVGARARRSAISAIARRLCRGSTRRHAVLTAIVSGYGALGGALIGQSSGYLAPPQFDVALAIALLACALVGGARYLLGAFVGAMILYLAPALLRLALVDSMEKNVVEGVRRWSNLGNERRLDPGAALSHCKVGLSASSRSG